MDLSRNQPAPASWVHREVKSVADAYCPICGRAVMADGARAEALCGHVLFVEDSTGEFYQAEEISDLQELLDDSANRDDWREEVIAVLPFSALVLELREPEPPGGEGGKALTVCYDFTDKAGACPYCRVTRDHSVDISESGCEHIVVELTENGEFLFGSDEYPRATDELEGPLSDAQSRRLFGDAAPVLECYEYGLTESTPSAIGNALVALLGEKAIRVGWEVTGMLGCGGGTIYAQEQSTHERFAELKQLLETGFERLNEELEASTLESGTVAQ